MGLPVTHDPFSFPAALTAVISALALILTLASAPPAAAKVRKPFRAIYMSQLTVLTERNTALLGIEQDVNGGFTDRITDCAAQTADPVGMAALADAVRGSAYAWRISATGVAKNVKGMVTADWLTNPADVSTGKRAANSFIQYASRGKEALYGVASAYEAMRQATAARPANCSTLRWGVRRMPATSTRRP